MDIWKRWVDQAILDALSRAIEERRLRGETEDDGFARLLDLQAALQARVEAPGGAPLAPAQKERPWRLSRQPGDFDPNANYGRM
jgi:hypothetical protein